MKLEAVGLSHVPGIPTDGGEPRKTRILFVTEGILLRRLESDPEVLQLMAKKPLYVKGTSKIIYHPIVHIIFHKSHNISHAVLHGI